MQDETTTTTRTARIGPVRFVITGDLAGWPVTSDEHFDAFPEDIRSMPHGVEKLVTRFRISTVDSHGCELWHVMDSPYFFGSVEAGGEADARDLAENVYSSLRSLIQYEGDELTRWIQWADEFGYFTGDLPVGAIRESVDTFRSIAAWESLIREAIGADAYTALMSLTDGEAGIVAADISRLLETSNPNDPSGSVVRR